ncbi:U1 small nuclear ribonucleoprotein C [Rhodotorula kratochvilovae]
MGKYYCDYCDVFLTHDSASVRRAHNSGRNHLSNVRDYYANLGSERAQELIDEICRKYENGGGGQARILQMGANGLPASMGNLAFVAPGAGAPPSAPPMRLVGPPIAGFPGSPAPGMGMGGPPGMGGGPPGMGGSPFTPGTGSNAALGAPLRYTAAPTPGAGPPPPQPNFGGPGTPGGGMPPPPGFGGPSMGPPPGFRPPPGGPPPPGFFPSPGGPAAASPMQAGSPAGSAGGGAGGGGGKLINGLNPERAKMLGLI